MYRVDIRLTFSADWSVYTRGVSFGTAQTLASNLRGMCTRIVRDRG